MSGSFSRTHRILPAVNPVRAGLPASSISFARPTFCSISAHCVAVRWSFHIIHGRSTLPASSSSTSPCICPVRPIPAMASLPVRERTCRMLVTVAFHQSSGFCSAQPGRGTCIGYSVVTSARTEPSGEIRTALLPDVPMSMPRRRLIAQAQAQASESEMSLRSSAYSILPISATSSESRLDCSVER